MNDARLPNPGPPVHGRCDGRRLRQLDVIVLVHESWIQAFTEEGLEGMMREGVVVADDLRRPYVDRDSAPMPTYAYQPEEEWLSPIDAAKRLRVSTESVRRWVRKGRVISVTVENTTRVRWPIAKQAP